MSKTITRKYIQRITKREGNTSIRQSGGGGGGGGGASQYWVEENYISKLFFNQLFTVYDEDGNVVEPNDTESVIASIKSMFGFWTDAYLSALGNGEGGGAELTLDSLADVDVHGVANGQALVYDAYTQKWVPGQAGLDPTSLWQELGSLGTEQISSTHLTTALSTYNPTNNFKTINGYSIIGTGDINVGGGGGSYLPLNGGTLTSSSRDILCLNQNTSSTSYQGPYISFELNSNCGASIGYNSTIGTYIDAARSGSGTDTLLIKDGVISFNGSANISGDLSVVGSISSTKYKIVSDTRINDCGFLIQNQSGTTRGVIAYSVDHFYISHFDGVNEEKSYIAFHNNGNTIIGATKLGIGISNPTEFLHVNGNMRCEGSILGVNQDTSFSASYMWGMYQWQNNLTFTRRNTSNTWLGDAVTISLSNGYVGIGTEPSYRLHVSGVVYASTGFYSGGYVTALSDARHKDVKGNVGLTVSEVANAPAVKFLWKDRRQEGLQVGSIAQYWQKVMPEAIVKNADGELTMSYGVIALLASIATARKVEDHERRIRELEEENKKLKKQLNAA